MKSAPFWLKGELQAGSTEAHSDSTFLCFLFPEFISTHKSVTPGPRCTSPMLEVLLESLYQCERIKSRWVKNFLSDGVETWSFISRKREREQLFHKSICYCQLSIFVFLLKWRPFLCTQLAHTSFKHLSSHRTQKKTGYCPESPKNKSTFSKNILTKSWNQRDTNIFYRIGWRNFNILCFSWSNTAWCFIFFPSN